MPPLINLSFIEHVAEPIRTINKVGSINRISGIVISAGKRAAFSSAFINRSLRNSSDRTLNELESGVPYFSA